MKKIYFLFLTMIVLTSVVSAQISLTASGGTPTGTFTTLKAAFDAINAGTHTGSIVISVNGSTTETTTPCVLVSSGSGAASYTDVLIKPTATATISGTTVAGRGLIELQGADNVTIDGSITTGTRDLTLTNTAAATINYTSVVRMATLATTVLNADNNTIKNCILIGSAAGRNASANTSTTGSENTTFGIYCGGNSGAAVTSVTTNTAPATTTINNFTANNNIVVSCARGIVFNGASAAVSGGTTTITNNLIGDQATALTGAPPYTAPATTVYTKGIYVNGTTNLNISNNSIKNIISYVGTTLNAIELAGAIGATGGTINVNNNTITGVVNNGASATNGILFSSATVAYNIAGNTISNIQTVGISSTAGITISVSAPSGIIEKNKISYVYANNAGAYAARGILISSGNAITIQNNMIWDLNAANDNSTTSTTYAVKGINISAGINHKVYHNTISLYGAMLGTGTNPDNTTCLLIAATSQTGIDVRNNIFSNTMTGATATVHGCIQLPSGGSAAMNLTINNNAYFAGTAANSYYGITQATFNGYTTLAALKAYTATLSASGTNDNASIASTAAAPFASPTNLHIPAATSTPLESSGALVGLTTDIDGDARPGPTGSVNGGGTAPDMGADEFDGVPLDNIPPSISYTPLSFTCATTARTLTATITDGSGVPTSGSGVPYLYYSVNGGGYTPVIGISIGSNQYTFTFGGGVSTGDIITYYIAAQDNVGNVTVSPLTGAGGFTTNPPAASTPPTTPNSYTISSSISGTKTVGIGGDYATLTAAVAAYNSSCLGGAVVFSLIDATYPTETFPIVINANPDANSTNTLTIRPASGASPVITGAISGPIIKLNGARFVTIDGSNSGGTTRNLTLSNTGTTTPNVLLIGSVGTTPIINSGIKNTVLINGVNTSTALVISDAATLGTAGYFNNITVQNNDIRKAYIGMYMIATVAAGNGSGSLVTGNTLISTGTSAIANVGLYVQGADGVTVSQNEIANFDGTSSEDDKGIWFATGTVNSVIDRNKIYNLNYTGTGGYGGQGMFITTGVIGSNIRISNNMIANMTGDGWTYITIPTDNPVGISVSATTTGVSIYNNSINLYGNTLNQTNALSMGIFLNTGCAADIRDNIIVNNLGLLSTTGYGSAGIYAATANTQFTAIDYNNYYVAPTGSGGKYIGQIASTGQTTLAGWKTATAQDANSINVAPTFSAPTDLHLTTANCGLDNRGVTLAGVTTDYDGAPRDAGAPDLGADEYSAILGTTIAAPAPGNIDSTTRNVSINSAEFSNYTCQRINAVLPSGASPVAGSVKSKVTVDATVQYAGSIPYVQRHYDIEPAVSAATATATVTLYYLQSEFDAYNTAATAASLPLLPIDAADVANNKANLKVTQYHGTGTAPGNYTGAAVLIDPVDANIVYDATNGWWAVTIPVTGFSGFFISTSLSVVPVSIEFFTGSKQGTANYLDWKVTCTSAPSLTLVLERSADGRNFSAIQTQNASATRCLQGFNYTDVSPLSGINYYRLKIITPDGAFKYSVIVALLNKSKGFELISVAPNPVKNTAVLSVTSVKGGKLDIAVSDITGKVVMQQTITVIAGNTPVNLDFAKLEAGTYQISAVNAEGDRKTTRFVKF